jgi:hypothetical protein
MSIILGLDVSTSCIGVCLLDDSLGASVLFDLPIDLTQTVRTMSGTIMSLAHIEFKGCATLFDKADHVVSYLSGIHLNVDRIVIEEPLMGFRPGMSSAQTITQLMRFNGIVSYIARNIFKREPEYIGSAHARKLCGIKLQRTALGGPQKEQVFAHMVEHDLKYVIWPLKKNGKIVDWSRDACDAYVIARSAAINGPIIPPVKKKKMKKSKSEEIEQ